MKRNIMALVAAALVLPACANLNSVYRTPGLHHGNSLVLDASEYVVVNGGEVHVDRDGDGDPDGTTRLVCAQPYPDSISATSAGSGLGAVLGDDDAPSVQSAFALGQAAASIGLRTQSIQLLRDQGYRLCESYLNGSLDAYNFRVLQRRHQALITATLAIEQLTGAVVAGQPAVQASASASAPDAIASLVNRLDEFQTRRANAQDIIAAQDAIIARASDDDQDNNPSPAELAAAQAAKADAQRDVANLDAGIAAIERALSEGDAGSAEVQAVAHAAQPVVHQRLSDTTATAVTRAVENITISLLEQDYTGQLCFDFARESAQRNATSRDQASQFEGIVYEPDGSTRVRGIAVTPLPAAVGNENEDLLETFCREYFEEHISNIQTRDEVFQDWQEAKRTNYPQLLSIIQDFDGDPEQVIRLVEALGNFVESGNGPTTLIRAANPGD